MTAQELIKKFNNEFSLKQWPETYEVDAITYANACQFLFSIKQKLPIDGKLWVNIAVGKRNGIMLKNVELILVHDKPNN